MSAHPYKHLEGRTEWKVLDRAISDLAKNGDLQELTPRRYILGYLVKRLLEHESASLREAPHNGRKTNANGIHSLVSGNRTHRRLRRPKRRPAPTALAM